MIPQPDYSPAMLRVFLYARGFAREDMTPQKARYRLASEIMDITGLPYSTVRDAFAGRCPDDTARAAIWAALGYTPGAQALLQARAA